MTNKKRRATQPAATYESDANHDERTSLPRRMIAWAIKRMKRIKARHAAFMARRPHRSFRRTRRRDYARSLKLPGYIAFTAQVWRTLSRHKRVFICLIALYAVIMLVLGGITNQATYDKINGLLQESAPAVFTGGAGKIGQAGLLLLSTFASVPTSLSPEQQVLLTLTLLMVWLCTVWLLREFLLERKPRLRDGLYNSGAPILSTVVIVLIAALQSIPVGLVALIYAGLSSAGILNGGFAAMIFSIFALTVVTLVLYWLTSTFIGMVVVTLPGMYPLRALRASSDLVIGRRLRILLRVLWGMLTVVVAWAVVMIPLVLLDAAIKGAWTAVANVPTMPIAAAIMTAWTTVWLASYIYLLYRKIVDDDAKPA